MSNPISSLREEDVREQEGQNPPDAESDAGVTKFITGVYRAGLDNLKKMIEG